MMEREDEKVIAAAAHFHWWASRYEITPVGSLKYDELARLVVWLENERPRWARVARYPNAILEAIDRLQRALAALLKPYAS